MFYRALISGIPVSAQGDGEKQREWREQVRNCILNSEYRPGNFEPNSPFMDYAKMSIIWYSNDSEHIAFKSVNFGDIDNIVKPIFDAIANPMHHKNDRPLIENDAQIVKLSFEKTPMSRVHLLNENLSRHHDALQRKIAQCRKEGFDLLIMELTSVWVP